MMISLNQIRVDEYRRRDLLAEAARARLITSAPQPSPVTKPRTVVRIRASLRHAVASLVAIASIG